MGSPSHVGKPLRSSFLHLYLLRCTFASSCPLTPSFSLSKPAIPGVANLVIWSSSKSRGCVGACFIFNFLMLLARVFHPGVTLFQPPHTGYHLWKAFWFSGAETERVTRHVMLLATKTYQSKYSLCVTEFLLPSIKLQHFIAIQVLLAALAINPACYSSRKLIKSLFSKMWQHCNLTENQNDTSVFSVLTVDACLGFWFEC